jgi:hypothetical protein
MTLTGPTSGANPRIRVREDAPAPTLYEGQIWRGPRNEVRYHVIVAFERGWVCTRECDSDGGNVRGSTRRRDRGMFGKAQGLRLPALLGTA